MMENTAYLLLMLAVGWGMGTVFDFYSTLTGATKYLKWLRPILDILFWVAAALTVYYITFITIQGEFRVYTFLLLGVGYLVYRVLFRRVVIGSTFAIVHVLRVICVFCGRLLYRLLGIPLIVCCKGMLMLLRLLYAVLCRLEDIVSALVGFLLKLVFFPARRFVTPDRLWRKKLAVWEQGFWTWLSNVLRKKPRSVS